MTETVLVALITFVSGLVGAVVGAIATYKAASFSEKANREKLLHDEKRAAYSAVFGAYDQLLRSLMPLSGREASPEQKVEVASCLHSFAHAVIWADIFAPRDVKRLIDSWYTETIDAAGELKMPDDAEKHGAVADAVRDDLLAFSHGQEKKRAPRWKR